MHAGPGWEQVQDGCLAAAGLGGSQALRSRLGGAAGPHTASLPGPRRIAAAAPLQARHPPSHVGALAELLDRANRLDAEVAALSQRVGILQAAVVALAGLALLPALWRGLPPRLSLWRVATACALGYGALETYKSLVLSQ